MNRLQVLVGGIMIAVPAAIIWWTTRDNWRAKEPFSADEFVAKSLVKAHDLASDAEVSQILATRVTAEGKVDVTIDGGLYVFLRSPSHPDRKDPLKPAIPGGRPPRDEWGPCPRINVKAGTWIGPRYGRRQWEFEAEWNRGDEISCSEDRWSSPAPVRCTIDAIWARAKAAGGSFAVRLRRDRR